MALDPSDVRSSDSDEDYSFDSPGVSGTQHQLHSQDLEDSQDLDDLQDHEDSPVHSLLVQILIFLVGATLDWVSRDVHLRDR